MADCKIVDASVKAAVSDISTISGSFKTDGDAFVSALTAAISAMEGETKDALLKFFTTDVTTFFVESLPSAIQSMSDLLEGNRDNFEKVDLQIAGSIGGS